MPNQHTGFSELAAYLSEKPAMPVQFFFDGSQINPGYHITEVKHATVNSLDCGKSSNVEQWEELTVQLLDGRPESLQGHMPSAKVLGILNSAINTLKIDAPPHLYFEFAPNNGPMQKLSIESIDEIAGEVAISLASETAVCKPFERFKAAASFGGSSLGQTSSGGCCSSANESDNGKGSSACCG